MRAGFIRCVPFSSRSQNPSFESSFLSADAVRKIPRMVDVIELVLGLLIGVAVLTVPAKKLQIPLAIFFELIIAESQRPR
jgi:hypothetical protein